MWLILCEMRISGMADITRAPRIPPARKLRSTLSVFNNGLGSSVVSELL